MFRIQKPFCIMAVIVLGGCALAGSPEPASDDQPEPGDPVHYLLADPADLDTLIAHALANHPELAAAEAELEAAEAEVTLAGALMDPQLSVTATPDTQRVTLAQQIPLFSKRRLAREEAGHRAEAARARRDQLRLEIAESVASRYAEYAYIQAADQILAEQLELLSQLVDVVRVRYQSGVANQADWLRMENERDSLAADRANLQASAQAAAAQLNAALGRRPQAPLPDIQPLTHHRVAFDEAALRAQLAEHHPGLKALHHELAARESSRELARRAGRPDLMVGVEHMRAEEGMGGNQTGLMLGINLPVWRGTYRAERERADADYRATHANYQDRHLQLEAELTTALFRWREAERNRELYGDSLNRRAEQALHAARTAYRAGNAGFTDLIDSQRQWLAFQLNHQRALADSLRWRAQIATLTGRVFALSAEGHDHE